jgi:hypothetical protein
MPGPYFPDQHKERCGHYYPDVLKLGDKKVGDDYFSVLDCSCCGTYLVRYEPDEIAAWFRHKLDRDGSIMVLAPEGIEKARKETLEYMVSRN